METRWKDFISVNKKVMLVLSVKQERDFECQNRRSVLAITAAKVSCELSGSYDKDKISLGDLNQSLPGAAQMGPQKCVQTSRREKS